MYILFFIQLASLFFFIGELRPFAEKTIIEGWLLTLTILLNVFLFGYIIVGSLFYTSLVSEIFLVHCIGFDGFLLNFPLFVHSPYEIYSFVFSCDGNCLSRKYLAFLLVSSAVGAWL